MLKRYSDSAVSTRTKPNRCLGRIGVCSPIAAVAVAITAPSAIAAMAIEEHQRRDEEAPRSRRAKERLTSLDCAGQRRRWQGTVTAAI